MGERSRYGAGWATEGSWLDSCRGQEIVFCKTPGLILGSTQRRGREGDCCPPSGAEIKKRISGTVSLPSMSLWHIQEHVWFSLLVKSNF
jgi:hypothetical protein